MVASGLRAPYAYLSTAHSTPYVYLSSALFHAIHELSTAHFTPYADLSTTYSRLRYRLTAELH
eukprot:3898928-Rhodomonas_salina.2